jgi:hypothetical protein
MSCHPITGLAGSPYVLHLFAGSPHGKGTNGWPIAAPVTAW